jgi:hypothetical protein
MAKRKVSVLAGKRRPPASQAANELERATIINMKGSSAYAQWLEGAHKTTHIPKVQIFRLAVAKWAHDEGLPAPPEI